MKKLLFYCQYLSGMGHLVRSRALARELAREFDVHLVLGGPTVEGFALPPEVEVTCLPALWLEDGSFRMDEGSPALRVVQTRRVRQLLALCDRLAPDVLVTEFFPFGRHKLLFELLPLLEHLQATRPQARIVSSVRDVIGKATLAEQSDAICALANRFFDLVLYHSDPAFQRFEDAFPGHAQLACPVRATGFVAERPRVAGGRSRRAQDPARLLVSVGGGRIGQELLECAVEAARRLAGRLAFHMEVFTGPFLKPEAHAALAARAAALPQVEIARFTPDLLERMVAADLSLSLCGYNTTMNVLATGVPAIMVPIGHYEEDQEQLDRTRRLQERGLAEVIEPGALDPERLAERILANLAAGRARRQARRPDLQGARRSAELVGELLAGPARRPRPPIGGDTEREVAT